MAMLGLSCSTWKKTKVLLPRARSGVVFGGIVLKVPSSPRGDDGHKRPRSTEKSVDKRHTGTAFVCSALSHCKKC